MIKREEETHTKLKSIRRIVFVRLDVVHEARVEKSGLFIYRFMGRSIAKRDLDRRVSF